MPRSRRFFGVSGLRGKNNSKNNSTLSKKTIVKTIVDFGKNNSGLAALYNINIKENIKTNRKSKKRYAASPLRFYEFKSSEFSIVAIAYRRQDSGSTSRYSDAAICRQNPAISISPRKRGYMAFDARSV